MEILTDKKRKREEETVPADNIIETGTSRMY